MILSIIVYGQSCCIGGNRSSPDGLLLPRSLPR
jgi:hypothetical protein